MTNIICDMCKKPIPYATRNWSWKTRDMRYDTLKSKDLCPDCLAKLDGIIRDDMEAKDNFGFMDYKKTLASELQKNTARAKRR